MSGETWHGTLTGYVKHKCRCQECRTANAYYYRARKKRLTGTLADDDPRHGTDHAYTTFGCRCDDCKAAHAAAEARRAARRKARQPSA